MPEPTARPATRRAAPPSLDRSHDYAAWRECAGEMVAVRTTFREAQGRDGPRRTVVEDAPRDVTGEQAAVGSDGASSPTLRGGRAPRPPARDRQRDRAGRSTPRPRPGPPSGSWRRRRRGLGIGRGRRGRASPAARRPPARTHHRRRSRARAHHRHAVRRHPDARPPGRPPVGGLPVAGRATGAARRAPRRRPRSGPYGPTRTTSDDPVTPANGFHAVGGDMPGMPAGTETGGSPTPTLPPWRRPATPPWGVATGRPATRPSSTPDRPSASIRRLRVADAGMTSSSDRDPDQTTGRVTPPVGDRPAPDRPGTDRPLHGQAPHGQARAPRRRRVLVHAPDALRARRLRGSHERRARDDDREHHGAHDSPRTPDRHRDRSGPGWRTAAAGAAGLGVAGLAAGAAARSGDRPEEPASAPRPRDTTTPRARPWPDTSGLGSPAPSTPDPVDPPATTVSPGHGPTRPRRRRDRRRPRRARRRQTVSSGHGRHVVPDDDAPSASGRCRSTPTTTLPTTPPTTQATTSPRTARATRSRPRTPRRPPTPTSAAATPPAT